MADKVWIGGTDTSFATAGNWSPSGVPATNDNLIFDGRAQRNLSSSLSQSAKTMTSIRVTSAFTYTIGTVASGVLTRLAIGCTDLIIGEPNGDGSTGSGSALLAFDFGSVANTTRILNGSTTGTSGFAPVMLLGTNAGNVLVVASGWVGVGTDALNEASTIVRADVIGTDANLELGGGCTLTTINQTAGNLTFRSAVTTLDQQGGVARNDGSGAITTATIGGRFTANSSGTITTATVINGGVLDLSQSTVARTITNTIVQGTGQLILPATDYDRITFTNGIDVKDGAFSQQVTNLTNVTLSLSAL